MIVHMRVPIAVDVFSAGPTLRGDQWPGDGPPVVLLHSGITDRRGWRLVGERLSTAGFRVVAYDMRGFGDTALTDEPFSHERDLIAVLDELGLEHVWIVGNSLGGRVALDAALIASERIGGLVLIAPGISGTRRPELLDPNTDALVQQLEAADAAGDVDEVNRLEIRIWLDGPASPEGRVSGPVRALALAMNAIALRNSAPEGAGASGLNAWDRLDEIRLPTTVACGELDIPFMIERCEELVTRLPNANLRMLPGVAHLPPLEDPAMVADLILKVVRTRGLPAVKQGSWRTL
jgi:pimeloyl-ACP methyl ester carboxylesterase